jgi:8-oxo-dGTP pyrophosphatase MutT (NUDIX family)
MLKEGRKISAFLKSKLKEELPGFRAHEAMMPESRKRLPADDSAYTKSAVMLLLYSKQGKIYFPVIERSDEGPHAGQLALPGGKNERTESLWQTALRETFEEIHAVPEKIECLGKLSELSIPVSRYRVNPFVGWVRGKTEFIAQADEVKRIIEVDLEDFISNHETKILPFQTFYGLVDAPCFVYRELKIWGATGMILNEFLCILQNNA